MKTRCSWALSFVAVATSAAAIAQDAVETAKAESEQADAKTPAQIEELVVYGKDFVPNLNRSGTKTDTPPIETPQSLSVVSRDLLDSWDAAKLNEALRYTPGVNGEAYGVDTRFTSIVMRGFSADKEGIFRDGLALINPNYIVSYNFDAYGAERVEIPRGPASVLYGQGSPGGLVNYVSKTPKHNAFGEVGFELGNRDRYQTQLDVGSPLNADGTVATRFVGLFRDTDSQFDYIGEKHTYVAPSLKWEIGESTSLLLLASFQEDITRSTGGLPADGTIKPNPNGKIPLSRFTGEPGFDHYHRTEQSLGYQFEHKFDQGFRFFQNLRYEDVALVDRTIYSRGLRPDMRSLIRGSSFNDNELRQLAVDNQLSYSFATSGIEHKLLAGVDYQDVNADVLQHFGTAPDLDIFSPVYGAVIVKPAAGVDDKLDTRQTGLYAQDEMKFFKKLILNLALRHDESKSHTFSRLSDSTTQSQKDSNTTYRAGLVYLLDSGFAPYASYATSFLPSSGTDANGNPFKPETGRQYEAGLKYEPSSFRGLFTLALFDLERRNFVDRDQNFVLYQSGQASSKGVEFEAFTALDNGLSLTGSYSYLKTNNDEFTDPTIQGKEFTQVPKHQAAAWADYNFRALNLPNFGIGFGARYVGATWSDQPNTLRNPSYSLFDAAIHYEWDRVRLGLNVQNLTDESYTSSCFVRTSQLCTFGEARSIRATIKYRW